LLLPVVLAAVVGGWWAAITTAAVATVAMGFAFVPPLNSFRFHGDALAVPVFLTVAVLVGAVVASEVQRRRLAEEANRAALLEQVDRQRCALLRSVSHDLRTPLATIRTATSELQASVVTDEAMREELLALVDDQAERLDRLVANLLDLSRIEAGALHPDRQAVDMRELVEDRRSSLARALDDVRVRVAIDPGLPLVSADYDQLGQVLANLVENAARHSPSGGTVTVAATGGEGVVEVVVADEGKGVAPDDAAGIFEPFRTGRGSGSTGIGLAICKGVVEAHGGTIWLADHSGGAAFHFTVPVCDG
jgi:two-component system sensor histidine kinase KdpD